MRIGGGVFLRLVAFVSWEQILLQLLHQPTAVFCTREVVAENVEKDYITITAYSL